MKRRNLILLCIIVLILAIAFVNVGFIHDFFSNNNNMDNHDFVDIGISNNFSAEWYVLSDVVKTVTDNGTSVSSSGDGGIYANKLGTSKDSWEDLYDWSSPFTIEFNVVEWSGTPVIRISNETVDVSKSFDELNINNGSNVKIISTEKNITYIIDGESLLVINNSLTNAQIGFKLNNASVLYNNFKIY